MQALIQFFTTAIQTMNFRNDNISSRILAWENEKKMRAKLIMERKKV